MFSSSPLRYWEYPLVKNFKCTNPMFVRIKCRSRFQFPSTLPGSTCGRHFHPRMHRSTDFARSSSNEFGPNCDCNSWQLPTCTWRVSSGPDFRRQSQKRHCSSHLHRLLGKYRISMKSWVNLR
uniref:(northern house mosquito) hypothetical protein n=1 Tax=Culex pipiens TaxID=7175 RepID=A0A8D8F062_CULPI